MRACLRIARAALLSAILVCGLGGLQAQAAGPKSMSLKLAVAGTSLVWLNYYYALENGYFKKAGLDLDAFAAKNGPLSAQALISDEADVGMGDFSRVFKLREKDNDLVAFGVFNIGVEQTLLLGNALIKALPEKATLDDAIRVMKGKTIAISGPGTTNDIILRYLLKSRGLNPDQYLHIVSLASAPALYIESFRNNALDGLITTEPIISELVLAGSGQVVFTTLRDMPPADRIPFIVAFAKRKTATERPAALKAFNEALGSASKALNAGGFEGAKPVLKKYFPTVSEPALRSAFAKMQWPEDPTLTGPVLRTAADWQFETGLIDKRMAQEELERSFIVP